jgi:hypothetical protein
MRTVLVALMIALTLALGALEVLASRAVQAESPADPADAFAIWHAR